MRQLKITHKITQRDSLALDKYLNDIGKIEMLNAEQEALLARRVREGDEEALNKLTRANLRFVISVAKQYQNQGIPLSDLINEGNLGLLKAARRFDETKGFKFISYAVWWVRQSILQALMEDSRMVRLPLNKTGSQNKLTEAVQSFMQNYEREPTTEELAEIMNIKEKDVDSLLRMSMRHVSVDAPIGGGEYSEDNITMLDTLTCDENDIPESKIMAESKHKELYSVIERLEEREQEVIKAYFGLGGNRPMTLEEIGEMCDLTRERVRQIKERALRRLRKSSMQHALRAYLG